MPTAPSWSIEASSLQTLRQPYADSTPITLEIDYSRYYNIRHTANLELIQEQVNRLHSEIYKNIALMGQSFIKVKYDMTSLEKEIDDLYTMGYRDV